MTSASTAPELGESRLDTPSIDYYNLGHLWQRTCSEEVTTNPEELNALLYRAWAPVAHLFKDGQAPTWHQFPNVFRDDIKYAREVELPHLSGAHTEGTLAKRPSLKGGGTDGWRAGEVKALKSGLFNRLAHIFHSIAEKEQWLNCFLQVPLPILRKNFVGVIHTQYSERRVSGYPQSSTGKTPSHLDEEATLAGLSDRVAHLPNSKLDPMAPGAVGVQPVPQALRQSVLRHIRLVAAYHVVMADNPEARADARPLAHRAQGRPGVELLQHPQKLELLSEENPVGFPGGLEGPEAD